LLLLTPLDNFLTSIHESNGTNPETLRTTVSAQASQRTSVMKVISAARLAHECTQTRRGSRVRATAAMPCASAHACLRRPAHPFDLRSCSGRLGCQFCFRPSTRTRRSARIPALPL